MNFNNKLVGVIIPKKITAITNGEITRPNNSPNFIHILLKGVNIFELNDPKIKKIEEIINDQNIKLSPFRRGHNAINKKTIKKTNPKFRLDGSLTLFILYQN